MNNIDLPSDGHGAFPNGMVYGEHHQFIKRGTLHPCVNINKKFECSGMLGICPRLDME